MEDLGTERTDHRMVRQPLRHYDSVTLISPALAPLVREFVAVARAGTKEAQGMQRGYSLWFGQPVVLQVATASLCVPLRGVIVSESSDAIRFRIGDGWDVDIYKNMILAVEEYNCEGIVN